MNRTERHIARLAGDYRRIGASPYLLTRIMAQTDTQRPGRSWRWPAVTAAALAAAVVWIVILQGPGPMPETQTGTRLAMSLPSMPGWRALPAPGTRPATPSLSRLGGLPVLPPSPGGRRADKPPKNT